MYDDRWENRSRGSRSHSRDKSRNEDSRSPFDRRNDQSFTFGRDRRGVRERHDSDSGPIHQLEIIPPPPPPINGNTGQSSGGPGMFGNMMGIDSSVMMNMFVGPNVALPAVNNSYMMGQGIMGPGTSMGHDSSIIESMMINGPMNPVKEIIHCKSCTLFPPNPNAPQPTTRDRPAGCKTMFVGGLPENITETILEEIFERCGEISTLRLSKKNFCHVRFVFEASVDAALFLSGYRVRIGSNSDPANTGRLHVDYAQARDDQYEFECRQRQLQREQRHRERMEEERLRAPSPPPVIHYTDHEASSIAEKIKHDDTFTKAVQVVVTWLERGDCSKRNVNNFYSMIQSTNAHVRRLFNEKSHYEDDLRKAKDILKGRMQGILLQFSHIERLFMAACHKKVWDHFTKAQRKNIEAWKKSSMDLKNVQFDDPQDKTRVDDEMDVSDDEEPSRKKQRSDEERNSLKDENDSLKCQVEAYKNEVEVLKSDHKQEIEAKEKQCRIIQHTLQSFQQQLLELRKKQQEDERTKFKSNKSSKPCAVINLDDDNDDNLDSASTTESAQEKSDNGQVNKLNSREAKLIGIISAFLNVHPFGAGLDYIWSYVSKVEPNVRTSEIEALMNRFPTVFKQELSGIGANIERKWIFIAFENIDNPERG